MARIGREARGQEAPRPRGPKAPGGPRPGPPDGLTARCPDGPTVRSTPAVWWAVISAARLAGVTAASDWAEALGEWAIPEEIIASAPESPWGFPVEVFADHARLTIDESWTPTHHRVAEALPAGGTLLDVGCGAGAASLPVAPPAGRIVAVDDDANMLGALTRLAGGRVQTEPVPGRWPEVAGQVAERGGDAGADVAVCANVLYNVADAGPFVAALTAAASRRVVLELSAVHPQAALSPLWRHFWGLERPDRPTAEDAEAVVREVVGVAPSVERWARSRSYLGDRSPETVAWLRRRMCLTSASDNEIERLLAQLPELAPAATVTLWWPGHGRGDSED